MEKIVKFFKRSSQEKSTDEGENDEKPAKSKKGKKNSNETDEEVKEWVEKYTAISESYESKPAGTVQKTMNGGASEENTTGNAEQETAPKKENQASLASQDVPEDLILPSIKHVHPDLKGSSDDEMSIYSGKKELKLEDSLEGEDLNEVKKSFDEELPEETTAAQDDGRAAGSPGNKMATEERKRHSRSPGSRSAKRMSKMFYTGERRDSEDSNELNNETRRESIEGDDPLTLNNERATGVSASKEKYDEEKSDLVKGFILEKKMLIDEHEKEKREMAINFMKERRELLKKGSKSPIGMETRHSEENDDFEADESGVKSKPPVLIKLDKKVVTSEEFLSCLELEKRYEREKEDMERSFREEKNDMKERLEADFQRRLFLEKRTMETTMDDLKREVERLKFQKVHLEERIKHQGERLELEFDKERIEMENEFCRAQDALRRDMEFKFDQELELLSEEHEKVVKDLDGRIHAAKKGRVCNREHRDENSHYDVTLELHQENAEEYDRLQRANKDLEKELGMVVIEKQELVDKLNQLTKNKSSGHNSTMNLTHFMEAEYEERIKKLVKENEELSKCVDEISRGKNQLLRDLTAQEKDDDCTGARLATCENLIVELEQSSAGLRKENGDLSNEIYRVRQEKQNLAEKVDSLTKINNELRRDLDKTRAKGDVDIERFTILEKEMLNNEKTITKLHQDLSQCGSMWKEESRRNKSNHEELAAVRKLLETERSENQRLSDRYRKDADLLRKKDQELSNSNRSHQELSNKLLDCEAKITILTDKLGRSESENAILRGQLGEYRAKSQAKHEETSELHNRFAQELTNRVEFIKSIYEKETCGLKTQIQQLRTRTKELEETLTSSCNRISTQQAPISSIGAENPSKASEIIDRLMSKNLDVQNSNSMALVPISSYISTALKTGKHSRVDNSATTTTFTGTAEIINDTRNSDSPTDSLNGPLTNSTNIHVKKPCYKNGVKDETKAIDFYVEAEISCNEDEMNHAPLFEQLLSRADKAESGLDKETVRDLLKEVRKEVNSLNQMLDNKSQVVQSRSSEISSQKRQEAKMELPMPPTNHHHDLIRLKHEHNKTHQYLKSLGGNVRRKENIEEKDSRDILRRLYAENLGLHEKLRESDHVLKDKDMSYQDLLQNRLRLEKLVSRLQTRLSKEEKHDSSGGSARKHEDRNMQRKIAKLKRQSKSFAEVEDDIV